MSISTRPRAHSLQNKESLSTLTLEPATTSIVVMERDEHATIISFQTRYCFAQNMTQLHNFIMRARELTYIYVGFFGRKNAFSQG